MLLVRIHVIQKRHTTNSFDIIPRSGALKFPLLSGKRVCTYLVSKEDFINFILLLKMLKAVNPDTKEKRK